MTLRISYVTAPRVAEVWDRVGPILQLATERSRGRYTVKDLLKKLEDGEYQLWVVHDEQGKIIAANTTRFQQYPGFNVLQGLYIAGERLAEWKDQMCEVIETIARTTGCKEVEFVGRLGWGPVLAENGYRPTVQSYVKVLN